jgi:glucokinase
MSCEVTVGLDVGGTKVAAVRLEGQSIADRAVEPTVKQSGDALVDQMARLVRSLATPETSAVGAGIPSAVEWSSGRALASVNVPFDDYPVRDRLTELTGLPAAVDNDANVAALAEASFGDRGPSGNIVMFTLGTGVGGGIVINGRVYRGATGGAGHLGHELVAASADATRIDEGFPRPESLEALAAGPALDALARQAARAGEGALAGVLARGAEPSGRDVVEAAAAGDPAARKLIETYAGRLALGVANMIHTFDPDEIVIGGGVSAAGDLLLDPLRAAVKPLILPGIGTRTTIRLARLGNDSGAVGAAVLARDEHRAAG